MKESLHRSCDLHWKDVINPYRFKGLVLIDRAPEKIWMEVHDIVQEAVIKTIPKKRNAKGKTVV